jgi:hypothetical protein
MSCKTVDSQIGQETLSTEAEIYTLLKQLKDND